jgi:hypothetical protein
MFGFRLIPKRDKTKPAMPAASIHVRQKFSRYQHLACDSKNSWTSCSDAKWNIPDKRTRHSYLQVLGGSAHR